jgi:hypothetical protein
MSVDLLLNREVFQFSAAALRQTCTAFPQDSLPAQYGVKSTVSTEIFRTFLSALNGDAIEVTKENFASLSELCKEFGFELRTPSYRISRLEFVVDQLRDDVGRLVGEVTSLRGTERVAAQLLDTASQLQSEISRLKEIVTPIGRLNSEIISDFPEIFAEFQGKQISLLWRSSRDSFKARDFHRRCDGHANILTMILDTKGNIFGGFTPVKWESLIWRGDIEDSAKGDDSLKSFVFTLKNPHNLPARKFALKDEKKWRAIDCSSEGGPTFDYDLGVCDDSNANTDSHTGLGSVYINDTGLDGEIILTGSKCFQVKEIEVFEILE